MKDLSNVSTIPVEAGSDGQRIDNFLLRECKGVPRSHIYRILRTGQVRVNSRRAGATYRLREGDRVRIPPLRAAEREARERAAPIALPVLYEDEWLLALDKPAGIAVHGGSGVSFGVIERVRAARPGLRFLELVHRLDRETSGVLLLAKKRQALLTLHAALREGRTEKDYLALVRGRWRGAQRSIRLSLRKYLTRAGERRVSVDAQGKESLTVVHPERVFDDCTLVRAALRTGRTHQIRVHLAHLAHPIAGDDKYGDFAWNRELAARGLRRMFLHAARMRLEHPASSATLVVESPLPAALAGFLDGLGPA
ncbi:MAG: RluA family pseudouridine synthase [Burkholderiales bacterium]|nr:RluA family pseudouridine synthase [Burkholderiales bacterium]